MAQGPEEKRGLTGRAAGIVGVVIVSFQISALRWGRVAQDGTYENPDKTSSINDTYPAGSSDILQNGAGTHSVKWHKSDTGGSPNVQAVKAHRQVVTNWEYARWGWLKAVLADSDLSDVAKILATILVVQFADHKTALCYPSTAKLAGAIGKSNDTVTRAFRALAAGSWLNRTEGRGRGSLSHVVFLSSGNVVPMVPNTHKSPTIKNSKTAVSGGVETAKLPTKNSKTAVSYNKDKLKIYPNAGKKSEPTAVRCVFFVEQGSYKHAAWDEHLLAKYGTQLHDLAAPSTDNRGTGWEVPSSFPPGPDDSTGNMIVDRWVKRFSCLETEKSK